MQLSGHTRKRGNNVYQYIIELPRNKGKRKRIYGTVRGTKKQAEHHMRELMAELENNTYIRRSNITVKEWMETWQELYLKDKSESTIAGYEKQIKSYIIPQFGDMLLQELTTLEIQKWVNGLYDCSPVSKKPMKPKTVRNIFLNLQAACHKAVVLELLKKSPCENVVLRSCDSRVVNPYNTDEVNKFVEALKGTKLEIPMLIDLSLGLRRGELLALQWNDIDFEKNKVHIRHNLVLDKNRQLIVKKPKSKSGDRVISLSPKLTAILKQAKVKYLENKLRHGNDYEDNNLVVCHQDGTPYNPDSFSSMFRRFIKKNNLRQIRLHDIRHTNCTQLLMNGVDMKTMQERLGHSDYSITANTYSHVLSEVDKHASEVADTVMFGNV